MQLKSIFVGKPKEVPYNGEVISTGIFKKEVTGAVKVNKFNLEGDKQADLTVHGGEFKAVYAYPVEHYDYWNKKRPDLKFQPGVFGENLCVSGLLENEVYVGDRYKIGTAVFSVTIPRLPCYKLGIKMNDSKIVQDFMIAERSGFYLKVVTEGVINPGDSINLVYKDTYGLTICDLVKLYTTEKTNRELLKKAVEAPALQNDWKEKFGEKLKALS